MSDFNWTGFNADDKAYDADNFAPLPAGWYPAVITKSEMKDSSKGGKYLKLEIDIVEGQFKGRKIFHNLNLINSNPQAVEIAKKDLAAICRSVNILHPRDSSELHMKPMLIQLKIKPATVDKEGNEVYPAGNDVKGFESIKKVSSAPQTAATTESKPAATDDSGKKPWEK